MLSNSSALPTPSASLDELSIANRRLQQENDWLRSQLVQLRVDATVKQPGADKAQELANEREAEVQSYVHRLRVDGATIIRQNEELMHLRQQCALYAASIEETTKNFEQLSQLYQKLAPLIPQPSTSVASK